MIDARDVGGEAVMHVEVAAGDDVVIAEEHAGDGGEEDLVGCQEGDEDRGAAEEEPGVYCLRVGWVSEGRGRGGEREVERMTKREIGIQGKK